MTNEPPLALRSVALHLGTILKVPKRKPAVSELLRLLKAGELTAGFEFPGTKVYWIPISTSYWTSVSTDKFRTLRYRHNDKLKTGTYKVRISDCVEDYIQVVSTDIRAITTGSTEAALLELKKALSAAQDRYEVAITNEEWTKYLAAKGLPTSPAPQRSSAGRPPKTSWNLLAPIIAGYMISLERSARDKADHGHIAEQVLQYAKDSGITKGVPAVNTLKDTISRALSLAEEYLNR
jgi:hypothetical protein